MHLNFHHETAKVFSINGVLFLVISPKLTLSKVSFHKLYEVRGCYTCDSVHRSPYHYHWRWEMVKEFIILCNLKCITANGQTMLYVGADRIYHMTTIYFM